MGPSICTIQCRISSYIGTRTTITPTLHRFFPLVLTKLIFIIYFTSFNIFSQEGYFLTNLEESDTREVL
jgi:hypothetical protein